MPGSTTKRNYPYPLENETADPALDIKKLADSIDTDVSAHLADFAALSALVKTKTVLDFPFNTGFTIANVAKITKVNNLVTLTIGVKKTDGTSFAASTDIVIGVLPEGYRPTQSIVTPVGFHSEEWRISKVGCGYIGSNGNVQIKIETDTTSKVAYLHLSFFV